MISVIIPAHNEQKNLEELLPLLILLREGSSVEILVSLSAESTEDLSPFEHDKALRVVRCTEKKGRAIQMNFAAKMTKGNVLVFLHADVRPPKDFFNDITETIGQGYDAGFFSYCFDKKDFFLKINASFTAKDGFFTGGGDQCLFIKKEVFEGLGRFDENQVLMEDFELFQRMKKNKVRYKIVDNDLTVSARKYKTNSYLRINLTNFLLLVLFRLGCPASKLKSLHDSLLRISDRTDS